MSPSPDTTIRQSLLHDVEALVSAIMADAPVAELVAITDRIAAAVDHWDGIPARTIVDLRSAIDLMCDGKACATVSALLMARSDLSATHG